MQVAKEKLSNLASSAKEHINIYKAKVAEKVVNHESSSFICDFLHDCGSPYHFIMCFVEIKWRVAVIQLERARARTKEEKKMAKERRKVKEASAKMELHKAKARHAEKKLGAKLTHGHGIFNYHHPPPAPLHHHQHQHGHQHLGTTNMIPASNPHV